ncbi:MAG TPA: asparagine synthase (glutamine-hydrolyzing) [Thermoanaerobaculia bacterium]|nr:asparagine synthase (glutamine-hydrolyzing) [Thermoanaerobaculia bacterium]
MCGIAGYFDGGGQLAHPEALARMVGVLRHRGPDDSGLHRQGPLGLGHSRLSILDLARGHQPLFSEDGGAAVICNGEIYNHRALRRELESRGHRFATGSDTEVVVHLYEEEGAACVGRLRGMFALAVADFRRGRLLVARDKVGKKPLYLASGWASSPGSGAGAPRGPWTAFASELKALRAAGLVGGEVDPEALDLYLHYGYVPAPWSIVRGATKLPAGHFALIDGTGVKIERYWDVRFPEEPDRRPAAELAEELEATLGEAVRMRLESDVPLGAFLSGGLDSGTVVSFMSEALDRPVLTHTVGFSDPALDERADAAAVAGALGTDHFEAEVTPDLAALLPRLAWHLDEPFADPSAVPTWYVARETRRRVTVALSGDGGDELFAGYPDRYGVHLWEERVRRWLPRGVRRALLPPLARRWPRSPRLPRPLRAGSVLANLAVDAERAYFQDRALVPAHVAGRLFGEELAARRRRFDPFAALEPHLARAPRHDPLARALYLDFKTWLADDCLVKVDRMSMAHGLEVRCPLLDQEVVELAARVPSELKLAGGATKRLLRAVAARRLPAQIMARPKRGFAPPVSRWLAGELHGHARELLLGGGAWTGGLLVPREVSRLLDRHRAGRAEAGWALWTLLMLEVWGREVARAGAEVDEREEVARAAAS